MSAGHAAGMLPVLRNRTSACAGPVATSSAITVPRSGAPAITARSVATAQARSSPATGKRNHTTPRIGGASPRSSQRRKAATSVGRERSSVPATTAS